MPIRNESRLNIEFRYIALLAIITFYPGFGQTQWQKYYDNPVMQKDTTLSGLWEWAGIGQPACLFENDTFKMWYAAGGVAYIGDTILRGRIGYVYSIDGINWIKRNPLLPVLNVGDSTAWDSRWCDTPATLHDTAGYKLYYYGDSVSVVHSAIGMAYSVDEVDFQRYVNNPILTRSTEILDWDGFWVESPAVLYDSASGIYHMWYTGVGYGPGLPSDLRIQIGYASSPDGANWTKDTINNPVVPTGPAGSWDDGWVAVPGVRMIGNEYMMWYCGASSADYAVDSTLDTAYIGLATSTDGINWVKYAGNPLFTNFDPPVDTGGPWAIDVVFNGIDFYMWYEVSTGISLATAPLNAVYENDFLGTDILQLTPNPFSKKTNLRYVVRENGVIRISVYNVAGQKQTDLVNEYHSAGSYNAQWDGTDHKGRSLPVGIYIIRMCSTGRSNAVKFLLIR